MTRIRISRGPSQASEGKASTSKTLTKTCGLCGWIDTLAIPPPSKASAFPRMKRGCRVGAATAPQAAQAPPIPAVSAVEPPPAPKSREAVTITSAPVPTNQQARPRPKKKKSSALQEMLARNKQKSQVQSKEGAEGTHGKLAAFLSDL
ncbi:hypothetical protein K525DRAFT_287633 [Schizophyllum commune Loenen D]|nr:hypothetical protein K525DRAFT_287633 [Schizophyllum commune Loenen D]